MSRAVVYNPTYPYVLAVGCGGRIGRGKEEGGGVIKVFSSDVVGGSRGRERGGEKEREREVVKLCEVKAAKQVCCILMCCIILYHIVLS